MQKTLSKFNTWYVLGIQQLRIVFTGVIIILCFYPRGLFNQKTQYNQYNPHFVDSLTDNAQ